MRILLVNAQGADLAAGGSGRYVADLARGLAARGHSVAVLAGFPPDDEAVTSAVFHAAHWRESRRRRLSNHVGDVVSRPGDRLRSAVAASSPDLVHTSNLPGFSTAVWEVARGLGLPTVHTLHDYHLLCPRSSLTRRDGTPCCPHPAFCAFRTKRLSRWAGAVSDVIGGSERLIARESSLFPHARLSVIRLPLVPVAEHALRPVASTPRSMGYLGGLDPIKGVRELLAAAPALNELGISLRLAGAGRLRTEVEAAPDVHYVGPVREAEKIDFIEETDIAVCPSTWEEPNGPNYVVAEWVAAARPVLCSTRGGLGETQALPGVIPIEPTAEGIVAGARQAFKTWDSLARLAPVTRPDDFGRWLDEHEAVYERAAAARRSSVSA